MGRWSRRLAGEFVAWLVPKPGLRWLDAGCGTGALTAAILETTAPRHVIGCDPSEAFIEYARGMIATPRATFAVAGIDRLPRIEPGYDYVVSGLVLNFLSSPVEALREMAATLRPGGRIAAYVWDYPGRMEFLRLFWDEAAALDPAAVDLDEGRRFPLCREGGLEDAFIRSGLRDIRPGELTIPTVFAGFDDFWEPFEKGTGPAPSYAAGLGPDRRERLKARLRERLAPAGDAPISLVARAWTASGELFR